MSEFKIFISQPIKKYSSVEEFMSSRESVIESLNALMKNKLHHNITILPVPKYSYDELSGYDENMSSLCKDLELIQEADAVYFSDDYSESPRCLAEYHICNEYKIPVIMSANSANSSSVN